MEVSVPRGFEKFESPDGVFIRNLSDNNVFKWISTRDLKANGIDNNGMASQYGRRSFAGIFDDFSGYFKYEAYHDPDSELFETSVKKHGGFFISTETFELCFQDEAIVRAKEYLKNSEDAYSVLPCGEAYDCLFEHIYERFSEYVLKNTKSKENSFDAWNRIVADKFNATSEIYGINDLLQTGYEHSSEMIADSPIFRATPLMSLDDYSNEKKCIDTNIVTWLLGVRHFSHPQNVFYPYRILILLK